MLEAVALTKKYGDFTALDTLNLKVGKGEIFCLLGGNGAGKTTTINLFLNFIAPSSGSVKVMDRDVTRYPLETKRHLAYIPENLMLYPSLTGMENLDFFCGLSGNAYTRDELGSFLEEAGLDEAFFHKKVASYSKGMRQKVGIAIALAKKASILLLDEPTSGLDPKASNEFAEHMKKLRQNGVAILMATHDLFRAKETGTRIGIMRSGKLVDLLRAEDITFANLERLYVDHMSKW